jgi:hypothetical protein
MSEQLAGKANGEFIARLANLKETDPNKLRNMDVGKTAKKYGIREDYALGWWRLAL